MKRGSLFQSTFYTEAGHAHLMATRLRGTVIDWLVLGPAAVSRAPTRSVGLLATRKLSACAIRSACGRWGMVKLGYFSHILASETCALDIIGAGTSIRDIEPGEVVDDANGIEKVPVTLFPRTKKRFGIFEFIYFARPRPAWSRATASPTGAGASARTWSWVPSPTPTSSFRVPDPGVLAALGFAERG